ncbi:MAG: hypothetical protein Q8927_15485 [Bacteroidota bacterium]|nr:hypothetical protein [Bacteroidota bacterium]MDP4217603.1 hypothetical protein [Bacteroidota bacterium]MDP4245898.1 hypothetical protein [Bacteroidota bacterium]MDP4254291.1 hypothetical protein [Bacteroidota bacterium]MDP4259228.1 hypothetical protein [Bacteroidota bacterium]
MIDEQMTDEQSVAKGGALSSLGVICLILCFMLGLSATGLLFFSLI